MTLQAYKNDKKLKAAFVKEIKWHQDQDKLLQGTYGEGQGDNFRGCAVGCSIHSLSKLKDKDLAVDDHSLYETELGLPEWLARLEDTIFEGLPVEEAKKWPLRFSRAIPVGADLEPVKWSFSAYLMKENIDRVLSLKISDGLKEQVVSSIRQVLAVHEQAIKTGKWDESAAWSARSAAWSAQSAAWSAAWSAESAAESAAWSARSAAWSAESAAESAARSAAWSAESAAESAAWSAQSAAFIKHSKELLRLLKEATV